MLNTMAFAEPRYPNSTVDLAGDALIGYEDAIERLDRDELDLLDIINNWKASHQYPQVIFRNTLNNRTLRIDADGVAVARNKRLASIKDKLERIPRLKLSAIQDIAGCHLIYRYASEKPKAKVWEGLKVEIQFRSVLQHCWATAVETADTFHGESLKFHRGDPEWRRFFALMGAAIAIREGTRHVPETPRNQSELVPELRSYATKLNVKAQLAAFRETLSVIGEAAATTSAIKHVLLVLEKGAGAEQLKLYAFGARDLSRASRMLEEEQERADAVLVSVSDATNLRRAYPNYYLDTSLFLGCLDDFIS